MSVLALPWDDRSFCVLNLPVRSYLSTCCACCIFKHVLRLLLDDDLYVHCVTIPSADVRRLRVFASSAVSLASVFDAVKIKFEITLEEGWMEYCSFQKLTCTNSRVILTFPVNSKKQLLDKPWQLQAASIGSLSQQCGTTWLQA
eukprot:3701270-Amphidinium_carterae.1